MSTWRRTAVLLVTMGLAACGGWGGSPERTYEGIGVSGEAGAIVVTAEELHSVTGSVLQALRGKVPNMRVDASVGRCPGISFRSAREPRGDSYPDIYVDGTRATNTCILESLSSVDVEWVELYPQGVTQRPGYGTNNQGLILIFLRRRD
jgi:hypothetical protein